VAFAQIDTAAAVGFNRPSRLKLNARARACASIRRFAHFHSPLSIALITIAPDDRRVAIPATCPALLGIVIGDKFSAERLTDIGVLLVSARAYKLRPLRQLVAARSLLEHRLTNCRRVETRGKEYPGSRLRCRHISAGSRAPRSLSRL